MFTTILQFLYVELLTPQSGKPDFSSLISASQNVFYLYRKSFLPCFRPLLFPIILRNKKKKIIYVIYAQRVAEVKKGKKFWK